MWNSRALAAVFGVLLLLKGFWHPRGAGGIARDSCGIARDPGGIVRDGTRSPNPNPKPEP